MKHTRKIKIEFFEFNGYNVSYNFVFFNTKKRKKYGAKLITL